MNRLFQSNFARNSARLHFEMLETGLFCVDLDIVVFLSGDDPVQMDRWTNVHRDEADCGCDQMCAHFSSGSNR